MKKLLTAKTLRSYFKKALLSALIYYKPEFRIKLRRLSLFSVSPDNYLGEHWVVELFDKVQFNINDTFLDIGSNVGQTLLKFVSTNKNGRYVGFEPNSNCVHVLNNIIKDNNLEQCTIIPVALSNTTGLIMINSSETDLLDPGATIVKNFRESSNNLMKSYVPVLPLDNLKYLFENTRVKVVKIDVEGAENEVLEGAENIFDEHKPILIMEVLPSYNEKNYFRTNRQKWVFEFLESKGYKVFQIIKSDEMISFKKVSSFPVHDKVELSDYLCLTCKDENILENFKVL